MASWDIHQTGIVEWLEEYEGPRFHAILADPPYALISIAKRFGGGNAPAQEGEDGRYARLSKGFMGASWDSFRDYGQYQSWVAQWSKLLIERALYPGAVCLFFGGTRTFHHLGVGLERGGFEIIDSVLIPWITGQGFPKSHSYTKAILDSFLRVSLQGGARSRYITEDSEDDYPCLLCGGLLRDALVVVREFEPSQDDAQVHIRPSSPSVEIRTDSGRTHKVSFGALSFHRAKPGCPPLKTWLTTLHASLESTGTLQREMPQVDKMAALGIPAAVLIRDLNSHESDSSSDGGSFLPNIGAFEKVFRKHGSSPLPTFRKDSLTSYTYLTRCCETCQNKYSRDFLDWQGRGTHLKPAWEPVYVCRAPRGDMTFAELAVEFGTGALNIDGSRIGHNEPEELMQPSSPVYGKTVYANAKLSEERDGSDELASPNPTGRWPANLLLTHHEACVKVGEYEVEGRVINRWKDGMLPFGGGAGQEYETIDPTRAGEPSAERTYEHEGGTDFAMKPGARRGMETVDLYACVPGCPVRALDDQVGTLTSGQVKESYKRHETSSLLEGGGNEYQLSGFGDKGGPSRFFYTAKASRSEKDKGLEHFYWRRTGDGNWERVSEEEWAELDESLRGHGCIHPTVKPLALLRYLANLILPPVRVDAPRRLLVPFSGSGSEMIGAMQAGWDVVEGVEMAGTYIEMAEARIRATIGML